MWHYAPKDINEYHLSGVSTDFVTAIEREEAAEAIWNLFWLSVPSVDTIPGSGESWWRTFKVQPASLAAIMADVVEDSTLRNKLCGPPGEFADWFEREDASIYDSYYALNGEVWRENVLRRAREAASRPLPAKLLQSVMGNVFEVNFGRRS